MTHKCVSKLAIIGSNNGLSPGRRQAIILTNAAILLIRPVGTYFDEICVYDSEVFIQHNALENVVCVKAVIFNAIEKHEIQ